MPAHVDTPACALASQRACRMMARSSRPAQTLTTTTMTTGTLRMQTTRWALRCRPWPQRLHSRRSACAQVRPAAGSASMPAAGTVHWCWGAPGSCARLASASGAGLLAIARHLGQVQCQTRRAQRRDPGREGRRAGRVGHLRGGARLDVRAPHRAGHAGACTTWAQDLGFTVQASRMLGSAGSAGTCCVIVQRARPAPVAKPKASRKMCKPDWQPMHPHCPSLGPLCP